MKYFTLLLSIYTFYLVTTPCVDEVLHLCNHTTEQAAHENPGAGSDHPDACSPFCICSCCNVPVTIVPYTFLSVPYVSLRSAISPESSDFTSSFTISFWQPPKIGCPSFLLA